MRSVALRYFNVFGPRQDPAGAYAGVIPRWIHALLAGGTLHVHGDGRTTRDFCPVANIVHANLLAATRPLPAEAPRVFNVGLGAETSLNELVELLREGIAAEGFARGAAAVLHKEPRPGDIRHSCASIHAARQWLGLEALEPLSSGLRETIRWFAGRHATSTQARAA